MYPVGYSISAHVHVRSNTDSFSHIGVIQ